MAAVKSTEVTMENLDKERKRLGAIQVRNKAERAAWIKVNAAISAMNIAKRRRKERGGTPPPTSEQLDPPPVTVTGRDVSGKGKQTNTEAPLDYASKKAKEKYAANEKRKAADKKEKARKAAVIDSLKPQPKQTAAQKKAAKGTSGEGPSIPTPKSRDTLGATMQSVKANKKKMLEAKRKSDATGLDPAPSTTDTFGSRGSSKKGSPSPTKKVEKIQAKIDKNEGADGPYGTTAGRNAIQGFFKDTFGIEDIEVDYSFPREGESQDKKKGGKVTAKKKKKASYGKKYSMNRGGKVASLRKPTRV
jgi:hypothetical protein